MIDILVRRRIPFIAYGPPEDLKSAFLFGSADYLKDPWSPAELEIRVKKQLGENKITFPWGSLFYRPTVVQSEFGRTELTFHEYQIFAMLAREQGNIVPREALFYALFGKPVPGSRAVDMHITKIRRKIRPVLPSREAQIIRSARNLGYYIPG
jgi:DNA-binding response OmpR family regulator